MSMVLTINILRDLSLEERKGNKKIREILLMLGWEFWLSCWRNLKQGEEPFSAWGWGWGGRSMALPFRRSFWWAFSVWHHFCCCVVTFAVLLDRNGQTACTVIADQTDLRMKYGKGWLIGFLGGQKNWLGLIYKLLQCILEDLLCVYVTPGRPESSGSYSKDSLAEGRM